MVILRAVFLLGAAIFAAGCPVPCPNGSMLDSPGGLQVLEDEHPAAWGDSVCAGCHSFDALHRQGCTPDVDFVVLREIVDDEGESSCASCHGELGVLP